MTALPEGLYVPRWDPDWEPTEEDMEFRLTYAGSLASDNNGRQRARHKHAIRKYFHPQLKRLWETHPAIAGHDTMANEWPKFERDGFKYRPLVIKEWFLYCKLDIVMLRDGPPGNVFGDIDNRLKTLFDGLRLTDSSAELPDDEITGAKVTPAPDEEPFYVLLEDDRLVTNVTVATDRLLEPVPDVAMDNAVRLLINVTIRPYKNGWDNDTFL